MADKVATAALFPPWTNTFIRLVLLCLALGVVSLIVLGWVYVRSPLFTGVIEGVGPRYCPSIEDKVVRFADRDRHQVFLEPEGLDDDTVYPNGVSTSLPVDVQEQFLRTMPGLERVVLKRPGYAIEYDHVDPRELWPTLEVKRVPRLLLAGPVASQKALPGGSPQRATLEVTLPADFPVDIHLLRVATAEGVSELGSILAATPRLSLFTIAEGA